MVSLRTLGVMSDQYCSKQYSTERDNGNIMREEGREVGGFGQFNDTMSQYGHLVSCMTILLKKI